MAIHLHRPYALIIEDELLSGLGLQAQLSDLGYRSFAFAGTERQALEQAEFACPDLVTVDVRLLDGNGIDAVEAILGRCGPLPVVYVTGDRSALSGLGDAVVIEKPVSDHALADAVLRAKASPAAPRRDPAAPAPEDRALALSAPQP